jgi:hypothetical protein
MLLQSRTYAATGRNCFLLGAMGTVKSARRAVPSPESIEEQILMAAFPFRRKPSKTERSLALAEAALAFAKDCAAAAAQSTRRMNGKVLALGGGAVAAAGAAALLKRDKIAGMLPSRSEQPGPSTPAPPQPSNYDAPGPVANTATPIPAPDPRGGPPATIDEEAEEAAAAAEAGAIGGKPSAYAGTEPGEPADEAQRPLAEAGEGEAEGQEQAEAALADNATTRGTGMTDAERQIEDAIDQAGQPQTGETPEPLATEPARASDQQQPDQPQTGEPHAAEPAEASDQQQPDQPQTGDTAEPLATEEPGAQEAVVPPAQDGDQETAGGGISGRPYAGLDQKDEADEDTSESPAATPETAREDGSDDSGT